MSRVAARAPLGLYTIADAARITGIRAKRIQYWLGEWGGGLLTPHTDPEVQGGAKFLSESDLVKIAVLPQLVDLRVPHKLIKKIFTQVVGRFWHLDHVRRRRADALEWIVVVWNWQLEPKIYNLRSLYKGHFTRRVSQKAFTLLDRVLDEELFRGAFRGFDVIELSNIKRDLLERTETLAP